MPIVITKAGPGLYRASRDGGSIVGDAEFIAGCVALWRLAGDEPNGLRAVERILERLVELKPGDEWN